MFAPLGANRATSRISVIVCFEIGRFVKDRVANRRLIAASTASRASHPPPGDSASAATSCLAEDIPPPPAEDAATEVIDRHPSRHHGPRATIVGVERRHVGQYAKFQRAGRLAFA